MRFISEDHFLENDKHEYFLGWSLFSAGEINLSASFQNDVTEFNQIKFALKEILKPFKNADVTRTGLGTTPTKKLK